MSKQHWLIAYDICNSRRLRKVFKLMKSYGTPVQYSLFECYLSARQERLLKEQLATVICKDEDRIHCYPLCGQCGPRVEVLGRGGHVNMLPDVWVVCDDTE